MATRIIGNIATLTVQTGQPRQWFERFNMFVSTNKLFSRVSTSSDNNQDNVAAANRENVSVFLSNCSAEIYSSMKSLANPGDPSSKTFEELKNLLCNHLEPKPAKTLQRYLFSNAKQKTGQSISDYVAELIVNSYST